MHGAPLGSAAKQQETRGWGEAVATVRDARHPQVSEKKILQPSASPRWALRAAAVPGGPDPSEFELKSFLCERPPASKRIWGKLESWGRWRGPAETRRRNTNGKQQPNNGDETQSLNLNKSRDEVCWKPRSRRRGISFSTFLRLFI